MKCNKQCLVLIVFSLALPSHLLSMVAQGRTILEFVQTHPKPQDLFSMRGRLFNASRAGIGNLNDIEKIDGIRKVWSITATGNNIEVVKANTFNYPQFKNLASLDLSHNKITDVEPGGFNGLESLRFLWLNGNKLTRLQDGALRGLKVKFVFIANNPGGKELQKQIQQQLPHANVYTVNITQATLKKAAIGIPIAIVAVVLGALTYQKITQREEELSSTKRLLGMDIKELKERERSLNQAEQKIEKIARGSDEWIEKTIQLHAAWQLIANAYEAMPDQPSMLRAQRKVASIKKDLGDYLDKILEQAFEAKQAAQEAEKTQDWQNASSHRAQAYKFYSQIALITELETDKEQAEDAQGKADAAQTMAQLERPYQAEEEKLLEQQRELLQTSELTPPEIEKLIPLVDRWKNFADTYPQRKPAAQEKINEIRSRIAEAAKSLATKASKQRQKALEAESKNNWQDALFFWQDTAYLYDIVARIAGTTGAHLNKDYYINQAKKARNSAAEAERAALQQ